jgi:hypothetical protein
MNCMNCVFLRKPFTPASCALRSRSSSNVQSSTVHGNVSDPEVASASASSPCPPPVDGKVEGRKPLRSQCSVFVKSPITTFLRLQTPPCGPTYVADEVRTSAQPAAIHAAAPLIPTPRSATPPPPCNPTAPLKPIAHLAPIPDSAETQSLTCVSWATGAQRMRTARGRCRPLLRLLRRPLS